MKIQLEQLDLLEPWPQFALREGFRAVRILVCIGATPIGQVSMRPVRRRLICQRALRRQIARLHSETLLKYLAQAALTAGPEALGWFLPHAWPDVDLARATAQTTRAYVQDHILLPTGLSSPLRDWVLRSLCAITPKPPVTIALCTRDREVTLESTIRRLQALDYPNFDILVVDNSGDAIPTLEILSRFASNEVRVNYIRCKAPGLSRARNLALASAAHPWIAFIDDDCRPEKQWLKELVRATQDEKCRAVAGLVLPAHLDNSAEIVADLREDSPENAFTPRVIRFDKDVEATWPARAGASLLVHRDFARSIGGFDTHLGPGPRTVGSGEDVDFLDRAIRAGGNVHTAPAAVVHHDRDFTAKSLRKYVARRAAGHAAILANRAFAQRDLRALSHLFRLPHDFAGRLSQGLSATSRYPFSLTLVELRASLIAPIAYAWAKLAGRSRITRAAQLERPKSSNITSSNTGRPPAPSKPRLAA